MNKSKSMKFFIAAIKKDVENEKRFIFNIFGSSKSKHHNDHNDHTDQGSDTSMYADHIDQGPSHTDHADHTDHSDGYYTKHSDIGGYSESSYHTDSNEKRRHEDYSEQFSNHTDN